MTRTEVPTAWDENDDLVVTRESLDPTAVGASATAAPSGDQTRSESPREQIAWGQRLTIRQKFARGGAVSLLFALTLYLLLGGPAATVAAGRDVSGAINAWLHPPKRQSVLADHNLKTLPSPPGAYNLPQITVAPVARSTLAAWVCWTSPYNGDTNTSNWTVHAYYTADGGAHWDKLALPLPNALGCTISADPQRPGSALFTFWPGYTSNGTCVPPSLFLTSSFGQSWTPIAWPTDSATGACQAQSALVGGAIYLWSTDPLIAGLSQFTPPTGRFIVSRDGGQSWRPADFGLDDAAGFDIIGFRPNGRILADIADVRGTGASSILLASSDFGASWTTLGELPGAFPQVYVADDLDESDHGGWGRLYAYSRTEVNSSPSVPARYQLATAYAGQAWSLIPLPPAQVGANPDDQANQPVVIGVGPAGSVEVEFGVVESRNSQFSPSRRLWIWDPQHAEWLLDPQPIPGNVQLQGDSWSQGNQVLWMTTLQVGVPPVLRIATKSYPQDTLLRLQ